MARGVRVYSLAFRDTGREAQAPPERSVPGGLSRGAPLYWPHRQTGGRCAMQQRSITLDESILEAIRETPRESRHRAASAGHSLHVAGGLRLRGRRHLHEGVALRRPRGGVRERGRLPRHPHRRRAPAGLPRARTARSTPSATFASTGASRSRRARATAEELPLPLSRLGLRPGGQAARRAAHQGGREFRLLPPARCRASTSTPGAATSSSTSTRTAAASPTASTRTG